MINVPKSNAQVTINKIDLFFVIELPIRLPTLLMLDSLPNVNKHVPIPKNNTHIKKIPKSVGLTTSLGKIGVYCKPNKTLIIIVIGIKEIILSFNPISKPFIFP